MCSPIRRWRKSSTASCSPRSPAPGAGLALPPSYPKKRNKKRAQCGLAKPRVLAGESPAWVTVRRELNIEHFGVAVDSYVDAPGQRRVRHNGPCDSGSCRYDPWTLRVSAVLATADPRRQSTSVRRWPTAAVAPRPPEVRFLTLG